MKKFMCVFMAIALMFSFISIGYAQDMQDELLAQLPEGAYKIMDYVYVVPLGITPRYDSGMISIGTVPAYGNIIQPARFNNVMYEPAREWLNVYTNDTILINFVSGTHTVFGSNLYEWPATRSNAYLAIYAPGVGMNANISYQLQCTSVNDIPRTITMKILSSLSSQAR